MVRMLPMVQTRCTQRVISGSLLPVGCSIKGRPTSSLKSNPNCHDHF